MKKIKNKKRVLPFDQSLLCSRGDCEFEYSEEKSRPELSVFVCNKPKCENYVVEVEDSGTGA